MSEIHPLIGNLAFILAISSICSIIFKWLKQPVVLAYIVGGIGLSFFLMDHKSVYKDLEVWADIGIIFLLFGLGLEFSFKKLLKVGPSACIATITIIILMIGLGYLVGTTCFGLSHITGLFLGAMLCMSSTTVIVKVFNDLHLNKQKFAGIVLGILVIEDLMAVVLMVLFSTVAISRKFEGMELLYSLTKLVGFLIFWFILGIYFIPFILRKTKRFLNDETLLIFAIALCLGMVFLATQAGYSSALGAFVMGSILSETVEGERIEKMLPPIKNLFGVLFFISVGMLVNVSNLKNYLIPIIIISLIIIIGQALFAIIGILLSGQNLKTAVFAGFSLTQIGEFSYIIGSLGLRLKVIDKFLYQIIVSTSIITIFITPYMMKFAPKVYQSLLKNMPKKWKNYFDKDNSSSLIKDENLWKKLLKDMITTSVIYFFLVLIMVFFSIKYGRPFVQKYLPGMQGNILCSIFVILFISPFIWMIIFRNSNSIEFTRLWNETEENKIRLIFTIVFRIVLCAGLIMYVLVEFLSMHSIEAFIISLLILGIFLTSKNLRKQSNKLERYWMNNLNEKYKKSRITISKGFSDHLVWKDLHLSDFKIEYYHSVVGKTLKELDLLNTFGIRLVSILRGNQKINIPRGEERIYPNDYLIVFGTDDQMEAFQLNLETTSFICNEEENISNSEILLQQFEVRPNSLLIGKNILSARIQEKFHCLLIGLERGDTSTLDIDWTISFEKGDILWIAGEYEEIKKLKNL